MKGDPLGGVHAFYSGSFREWWNPLRPGTRVTRRNALVGVHDKQGEFAGRAVHEWFGEVFAAAGGPVLAGQYRLMIRAERDEGHQARARTTRPRSSPYTDEEIDGDRRGRRRRARPPAGRRAPLVGGRRRGRRARPAREGADAGHRHGGVAHRHGHGPLRREGAAPRARPAAPDAPLLPARRRSTSPTCSSGCTGTPSGRERPATPPATTTAGCARRGSSTSAPTGWATTPGSGSSTASSASSTTSATPTGCAGRVTRKHLVDGGRPAVDLDVWGENQRGETTTPGHATILLPSPRARRGPRCPDPPGGATTCQEALDALAARFAAEEAEP